MKTVLGIAAILGALAVWQSSVHAATTERAQPLTRADCNQAGLAWDDRGNVCDGQQLASELDVTGSIPLVQPLTRADCDQAGLAWDESGNVCDWQANGAKQHAPEPDVTGSIQSVQPLTRADCDQARLA